jgi:hypothetical protein
LVATATIKVPLNLAADRAFVAKLDLFKFVPVRLNRLAAEISADPELAQSVAIIEYLDETLRSRC